MRPGEIRELDADEKAELYRACLPQVVRGRERKAAAARTKGLRERRKELRAQWRRSSEPSAV